MRIEGSHREVQARIYARAAGKEVESREEVESGIEATIVIYAGAAGIVILTLLALGAWKAFELICP